MKKLIKSVVVFVVGIIFGYYICSSNELTKIFSSSYKAFQVGVYTSLDAANTYRTKYKDSIVIKDNELYRVYVSILKEENNIENMSKYLNNLGIDYYLKDISIDNKETKKEIQGYESLMNSKSEVVFLELNKMIMETYKESLWD